MDDRGADISAMSFEDALRALEEVVRKLESGEVPLDDSITLEAMRYAAIGGGKRLRPLLLTSTAEMYGVDRDAALRAAVAVEAIHVY